MALSIKKVLVSQSEPASEKSPYSDLTDKYGVEVCFHPFCKSRAAHRQRIQTTAHHHIRLYSRCIYGTYRH